MDVVHTEELEKSLFLAFEIESDVMICSLKPVFVQHFQNNFHLGVHNSVQYYHMRVPASVSCRNAKRVCSILLSKFATFVSFILVLRKFAIICNQLVVIL